MLVIIMHHIICDGTTASLIFGNIAAVYDGKNAAEEEMSNLTLAQYEAEHPEFADADNEVYRKMLDSIEGDTELYYKHSFPADSQQSIAHNVIPELNSVAVFSINKDVRLVLRDNVPGATVTHLMIPVWHHMFTRSFTGHRNKLYAYFHDKQLEVFSFQQNRFKFCNSYDASLGNDSLYFLLYVWKQLNLQPEHDEMDLFGDIPQREWLLEELRRYLHNAYVINPSAEFNRTPATRIKDMPFDLVTLLTKGR